MEGREGEDLNRWGCRRRKGDLTRNEGREVKKTPGGAGYQKIWMHPRRKGLQKKKKTSSSGILWSRRNRGTYKPAGRGLAEWCQGESALGGPTEESSFGRKGDLKVPAAGLPVESVSSQILGEKRGNRMTRPRYSERCEKVMRGA